MHLRNVSFLLLFIFTVSSCHNNNSQTIISQGKMENILYDYHLAQAIANQSPDSLSYKSSLYTNVVFKNYGVSKAKFDSSLLWYAQHTDVLCKIYDNVNNRLKKEATALGAATNETSTYSSLTNKGDTANLWNGRAYYLLSPIGVSNRMTFSIPADTTFHRNDRFLLRFRSSFIFSEGARSATVCLYIIYDNDSVSSVTHIINISGDYSIFLDATTRKIKYVNGFVYLNASWSKTPKLLFLTQPSLIRFHKKNLPIQKRKSKDSLLNKHPQLQKQPDFDTTKSILQPHARPMPKRQMNFFRK